MMKAIGLTGCENENQAIVAAQLLDRINERGLPISICIGITTVEEANLIHLGSGEVWRVGGVDHRQALSAHVDRVIDTTGEFEEVIERVDRAIASYLGKTQVAA